MYTNLLRSFAGSLLMGILLGFFPAFIVTVIVGSVAHHNLEKIDMNSTMRSIVLTVITVATEAVMLYYTADEWLPFLAVTVPICLALGVGSCFVV